MTCVAVGRGLAFGADTFFSQVLCRHNLMNGFCEIVMLRYHFLISIRYHSLHGSAELL